MKCSDNPSSSLFQDESSLTSPETYRRMVEIMRARQQWKLDSADRMKQQESFQKDQENRQPPQPEFQFRSLSQSTQQQTRLPFVPSLPTSQQPHTQLPLPSLLQNAKPQSESQLPSLFHQNLQQSAYSVTSQSQPKGLSQVPPGYSLQLHNGTITLVPVSQSDSHPVPKDLTPVSGVSSAQNSLKRSHMESTDDHRSKQVRVVSDLVDLVNESSESDDDIEELTESQFYAPRRKRKPIIEESENDYELIDVIDSSDSLSVY